MTIFRVLEGATKKAPEKPKKKKSDTIFGWSRRETSPPYELRVVYFRSAQTEYSELHRSPPLNQQFRKPMR
jgi:hypothetical protein